MSLKNNYIRSEETEISISSILSLGFTKIKSVLIAMIVCFLLLSGLKVYSAYNVQKIQTPTNSSELINWEYSYSLLNVRLQANQNQWNYLTSKNNTSAMMALDANCAVKAIITMAVDSENTANQYVNYFNSINLSLKQRELSTLTITTTDNISRDVDTNTASTTFYNYNTNVNSTRTRTSTSQDYSFDNNFRNCFLKLTVYSIDEKSALADADFLYEEIKKGAELITSISGKHTLTLIDRFTESGSDIAEKQYQESMRLADVTEELISLNKASEELRKTKPSASAASGTPSLLVALKSSVKWAVIGAVLGAFIMCLYLLISFIGKAPVTSSFEMAERTGLSFIGGYYNKRSWNTKVSDRLLNERTFASAEAASSFIIENVKTLEKTGTKILVASSYYGEKDETGSEISLLLNALKSAGCEPVFAGDALTSASFIAKLHEVDSVIILEKRWYSRWQNTGTELEMIEHLDKPVIGFVLA